MKVVAVIQARTASIRLPGKVLEPIGPLTMIERGTQKARGHPIIFSRSCQAPA